MSEKNKILLVDDDLRNTFALSRELEDFGMQVSLADNGQLALDKLQSNPDIDLVLMDIMMPVMSGIDAIQEIRSRWPEIKIVAMTSFEEEALLKQ